MITQDMPYRVGSRALVYMILRKMKVPFILAIVLVAISFIPNFPNIVAPVEYYGTLATILLAVCLALTVLPEYYGLTVTVSDAAFRVRSGIISHREIAIPYRQIQTINLVERALPSMFGLCSLLVVTSAHDDAGDNGDDSEATLPLVHKSLARDLQSELLRRTNTNGGQAPAAV